MTRMPRSSSPLDLRVSSPTTAAWWDILTGTFPTTFITSPLATAKDLILIAPATADVIAKLAHGIADDMLTTVVLAAKCKKLVAPAMNTAMLENPITQDNPKDPGALRLFRIILRTAACWPARRWARKDA